MQKIRIFLGSSVDKKEFELERETLGSFINGLNKSYIDKGIFIELYNCEDVSPRMRPEGSQKQHDDFISNEADAAFFLFFRKAGEFTLHELKTAHDTLANSGRPDVFIYFKIIGNDLEETDEIKKAVDLIANGYGHYFNKFAHVDTVKLGMLQYIADKLGEGSEIAISGDRVMLNDEAIDLIDLDNVLVYQNNPDYNRLKKEIMELKDKIKRAAAEERWQDVDTAIKEKEKRENNLLELENNILEMLLEFRRQISCKEKNPKLINAYQLLEAGRVKEALGLFPIDTQKANLKNLELKKDNLIEDYKTALAEGRARIDILNLDLENASRFSEIEETYDIYLDTAFRAEDCDFIISYARYLNYHYKDQKAYEIAKKLEGFYAYHTDLADNKRMGELYLLLALLTRNLRLHKEFKGYCSKAINAYKESASSDNNGHTYDLASSYFEIGRLSDRTKEAEDCFRCAIEILEARAKQTQRERNLLARAYYNMGKLFNEASWSIRNEEMEDIDKAVEYFVKSKKIFEEVPFENRDPAAADLYCTIANTLVEDVRHPKDAKTYMKSIESAERYFLAAVKFHEKLAGENPYYIYPELQKLYGNIHHFYSECIESEYCEEPSYYSKKAEEFGLKTIEVTESLVKLHSDDDGYLLGPYGLSNVYYQMGYDYYKTDLPEKAEEYYQKSLEIAINVYNKYKNDPETRYYRLCATEIELRYNDFAKLYKKQGNIDKAAEYYLKVVDFYEHHKSHVSLKQRVY